MTKIMTINAADISFSVLKSMNLKSLKSYGKTFNLERFKNKYKALITKIQTARIAFLGAIVH
jgi:hypothetical protein